jgi:hypothetical protein
MKGPGERLKYDFRRVWECPVCRHRERTGGDVTYRLCACQRKLEPTERVWMRLIQEGGRRGDAPKFEPPPPDADAPVEEFDSWSNAAPEVEPPAPAPPD